MTPPRLAVAALTALGALAAAPTRATEAQAPHTIALGIPASAGSATEGLASSGARPERPGPTRGARPARAASTRGVTPRTAPSAAGPSVARVRREVATSPHPRVYSDVRLPIAKARPAERPAPVVSPGLVVLPALPGATRDPVGADSAVTGDAPPTAPTAQGGALWLPRTFFGAILGGAGIVAVTRRGGKPAPTGAGATPPAVASPAVPPPALGTPAPAGTPGGPGTPADPGPSATGSTPPGPPTPATAGTPPGRSPDVPPGAPPGPPGFVPPRTLDETPVVPSSTTVPEPASVALVGAGLAALALGRRRRR